ncbi:hypothetical protein TorRG33x02_278500 [Trema orientale]|uniref:Uncharacterized protein n=1 Tax=Trema orientale TaxID=63057 RepID=A0A2P5CNS5_TREOI|nr:hypothetical protein TorRG33x02_278500 [Trema orientale]
MFDSSGFVSIPEFFLYTSILLDQVWKSRNNKVFSDHAGLVENDQIYFESISWGGREDFKEAEGLPNQMTVEPDATVWKALLAASGGWEDAARVQRSMKSMGDQQAARMQLD